MNLTNILSLLTEFHVKLLILYLHPPSKFKIYNMTYIYCMLYLTKDVLLDKYMYMVLPIIKKPSQQYLCENFPLS